VTESGRRAGADAAEPVPQPRPADSGDAAGSAGHADSAAPADPAELSARDRAVLDVAALTFARPGVRERTIRERLGMSPTAYFQLLNALLDDPRALAYEPVTVNRLRRERERRRDER
jgi:hypothetical protein